MREIKFFNPFIYTSKKDGEKAVSQSIRTESTAAMLGDENLSAGSSIQEVHKYEKSNRHTIEASTRDHQSEGGSQCRAQDSDLRSHHHMDLFQATIPQRSCMRKNGTTRRESIQSKRSLKVGIPGHNDFLLKDICIQFNEIVRVKPVVAVYDLVDDLDCLWFQDDEYDRIRTKIFLVADKHVIGEHFSGQKLCIRGLESILEYDVRQDNKVRGWEAVLAEQRSQRDSCNFDDTNLGQAYQFSAQKSKLDAEIRARQDEKDVQKYLKSTRRFCEHYGFVRRA
jgi:hypothetical protein